MGRLSAFLLVLALSALSAAALSACGSGGGAKLLPGSAASEISANLNEVMRLVREGDCVGAEDAAGAVSTQIEGLGGVDEKLKRALSEGAARLGEVVEGCEETEEEPEEQELEPLEPVEEPEGEEDTERKTREKPEKQEKTKPKEEVETPSETTPTPPSAGNGKGEGPQGGGPPTETTPPPSGGSPSGGIGPATEVGGE